MGSAAPSNILIELTEGDSREWPGLEVDELLHNGQSAEIEHDAGMLQDALSNLFKPPGPGTYFLFGFVAFYSRDYYGEVDVDYDLEGWRVATDEDKAQFFTNTAQENERGQ
jgi:hypothetical protein